MHKNNKHTLYPSCCPPKLPKLYYQRKWSWRGILQNPRAQNDNEWNEMTREREENQVA